MLLLRRLGHKFLVLTGKMFFVMFFEIIIFFLTLSLYRYSTGGIKHVTINQSICWPMPVSSILFSEIAYLFHGGGVGYALARGSMGHRGMVHGTGTLLRTAFPAFSIFIFL